jgi:hypothetical protein
MADVKTSEVGVGKGNNNMAIMQKFLFVFILLVISTCNTLLNPGKWNLISIQIMNIPIHYI